MPSLYLLYRLDGHTVIPQLLKLEIKVIQPGNKLRLRRVAFDDDKLLGEDSFDDKTAPVMLRSGFAEQFVEADVLLFIEAERVFIAQRSGLLSGLVCQFSVGIHNIGSKGVRLGRTPGLAERAPLSDKCQFVGQRYSSLASSEAKNPRRKNFRKIYAKPPLRLPRVGRFPVQYYNRFGAKKSHRCGLERTGADIGTEAFYPVVYCGRIDYSGNCANRKISIGSDGYPNL